MDDLRAIERVLADHAWRARRSFEDDRWVQHLAPASDPGTDG